ncbi:MAG: glycosyltransferase [Clostridia bacterium]|nr:glycosyltransferase [Clostridia bacterium]
MGTVDAKPVKKKILFLLEGFDKGGIEKVTLDIVNHLDPDKYDITVQTFWYGGHCQSLVHGNVKVIPFFFKRYVRGIIRLIAYLPPKMLYRLFVHGDYDVEIAASDGGAAKVISGSCNKKAKKICWVHMDVVERGSQLKEFKNAKTAKPIYEKFNQIICVSNACMEKFKSKFGHQYRIDVRKNPLPVKEIIEKSIHSINLENTGNVITFSCVGRLVEQKGFDRLLEVCRRLIGEGFCDFKVYVAGEGPERGRLETLIRQYSLEEHIVLLGFLDNPYSLIKRTDAFLLTSRDEAYPLVVGESLIVGTPPVATECSGVSEWLEDGMYGLLMQNSEEGIYQGIKHVLLNPECLVEYRNRIPNKQRKLSFEKAIADFETILE